MTFIKWKFQFLFWNYVKRKKNYKDLYIPCCIWNNTWFSPYLLNWELARMIFVWPGFLPLVQILIVRTRWNLLVYLKFIPPRFVIACFYWKLMKTWCLLKKCMAMIPGNHWVNNFCLEFLYFGFFLFLNFSIKTVNIKISSEANSLLILEVVLETWTF